MVTIQETQPATVYGGKTRRSVPRPTTYSFSYYHSSLGIITIRTAAPDDITVIRDKMYTPMYVHTGRVSELFDPHAEKSYARIGGIFNLPSDQELIDIITHGAILMVTCRTAEGGEELMAIFVGYRIDIYRDLCSICQVDEGTGPLLEIDHLPSFDGIETFERRPFFVNKRAMQQILDLAGRKHGAIFTGFDALIDFRYHSRGIFGFVGYKVFKVLKMFYNCAYFLIETHDVSRVSINGKAMLDNRGSPVAMADVGKKMIHRRMLDGIEIGFREPLVRRLRVGSHVKDGHLVRDKVEVEIKTKQWIFSIDNILSRVPQSNRNDAKIAVP